ncbi:hypothetical protein [Tamlana crocina]|uniref:Anti-sigma factor n=1 Tax=Tamlana crocina TaxID=393006 RepID=A0ABX1DDD1_9FLAO|nr:hypothetical protein [Tamlana crocina]NJX15216.1 hypothetical protein [Tamlana crocina]
MAPLKYEEELKNKLEKRNLQPSKQAWERLSNRLDNELKPNNNKLYWWLGVAASFIGVAFVVTQFFSTNNTIEKEQKIVTTPKTEQNEIIPNNNIEDVKMVDAQKPEPKPMKMQPTEKAANKTSTITPDFNNTQTEIVSAPEKSNTEVLNKSPNNSPLTFEEQKIQDVVAQIHELKQTQEVTDADIDALLKKAEREIKLNRIIDKNTGVVDANALLEDVEAELDQSFRTKVFEAIKASYNTVKTAVAQRND